VTTRRQHSTHRAAWTHRQRANYNAGVFTKRRHLDPRSLHGLMRLRARVTDADVSSSIAPTDRCEQRFSMSTAAYVVPGHTGH
jgi:hypothetical protein